MKNYGLATPQILLPNKKVNLKKWAVVACDQYNSNEAYWKRVERFVGNNASTLHIILPEIYLDDHKEDRIINITAEMEAYVADGVVEALPHGFILVQRELEGATRTGLIGMIDLEKYNYKPTKKTLVRPTEETVMERIPPRVEIRKPALIESPHILVLLNDPRKKVIEPLVRRIKNFPMLYDFDLMENGGRIKGNFVGDKEEIDDIYARLESIAEESEILFAVGDGNHSLATAKTVWDEYKQGLDTKARRSHPKRFALVEIVNLYDEGLIFEPIHRVVFNVDTNQLIQDLVRLLNRKEMDAKVFFKRSSATKFVNEISGQTIDFIAKGRKGYIQIAKPLHEMEAVNFQDVLDEYLKINPNVKVEYIHGEDELERLCEQDKTTGFILPTLDKHGFIEVLSTHGVLPKKCFSLGEANGKRYYLESRLLDEIMEVEDTHAMFHESEKPKLAEQEDNLEIQETETDKTPWLDRKNNEDIISMAFAEQNDEEVFDQGSNEFLDVEPNPEDYLSARELRKLKQQQRIDALLGETEHTVEEPIEELLEDVDEPPMSRRELKLLKRQQEYDYLLEQINQMKVEQTEEENEDTPRKTIKEQAHEQHEAVEKDSPEEETEAVYLTPKQKRQLKREQRQQAIAEMLEEQEQSISDDADEAEGEQTLTKREMRAIRRQEKLEALLGEIEEAGIEMPVEDDEQQLSKRELKKQRKEEKRQQRIAEIEAWEQEAEAEFNRAHAEQQEKEAQAKETELAEETSDDDKERKRLARLKHLPEISEALREEDEEEADPTDMLVSLEKARLKLEAEKIRLERFRIKEETKLKLQIERERQRAIARVEAGITDEAIVDEPQNEDEQPEEASPGSTKRKRFSEIIGEIIHEVKHEENQHKEPETVIVRRDTNEIVGRTFQVEHAQPRRKEKRRKGTVIVKRAGNSYK